MKTTLNKIRTFSPCADGWSKLLKYLNKTAADNEPLDLLTILESNGIEDTIWCLRATEGFEKEIRTFARYCAQMNIEKIKPYCSGEDYKLILRWLNSGDESIRSAAWSAAWSAAESAASAAWSEADSAAKSAWSAIESAADSAAWSAAWSAADSAAKSAADSAAWKIIGAELKKILEKNLEALNERD